ncbi:MAG: hypothetical protein KF824_03985 [Fimbriimonadaceae bacterium]|nr:MAG: hypothetical protein KF824_03985 [Fimbriimonadaceae bacterium]
MNRLLKIAGWTLLICIIGICGFEGFHLTMSAQVASRQVYPHIIFDSLQKSIQIYASDYDDRLPAASSMPTFRALLSPYEKTNANWKSDKGYSQVQFNFNLAGVELLYNSFPDPLGYEFLAEEPIVFYIFDTKENRYATCGWGQDFKFKWYLGGSQSENKEDSEFFRRLSYQYDRKGAKLFPPDYLANEDPLKK